MAGQVDDVRGGHGTPDGVERGCLAEQQLGPVAARLGDGPRLGLDERRVVVPHPDGEQPSPADRPGRRAGGRRQARRLGDVPPVQQVPDAVVQGVERNAVQRAVRHDHERERDAGGVRQEVNERREHLHVERREAVVERREHVGAHAVFVTATACAPMWLSRSSTSCASRRRVLTRRTTRVDPDVTKASTSAPSR